MTENQDDTTDTMADVSHTNPYTGETAGRLFSRGPTVVADGGERDAVEPAATDRDRITMRDVDHTPPEGAGDATPAFERGQDHPVEGYNE